MPDTLSLSSDALKREVLTLLGENRTLCVATIRPDGWPQATMVGYIHDDLTLYFAVARSSQKFANILRDPRVSIAIGHDTPKRIRGLSLAARVTEVIDHAEIARINGLLHERYPAQTIFAPREASAAVLKATPLVVSIVNLARGPGKPQLVALESETRLRPVEQVEAAAPRAYGPPPDLG